MANFPIASSHSLWRVAAEIPVRRMLSAVIANSTAIKVDSARCSNNEIKLNHYSRGPLYYNVRSVARGFCRLLCFAPQVNKTIGSSLADSKTALTEKPVLDLFAANIIGSRLTCKANRYMLRIQPGKR